MNLKELLRFEMITELCLFVWNAADMATVFQESYNSILFYIILASTVYLSFSASGFHGRLGINRVDRKLFRFRAFFQNISIQIYFHFLTIFSLASGP